MYKYWAKELQLTKIDSLFDLVYFLSLAFFFLESYYLSVFDGIHASLFEVLASSLFG
jgi:hypothetical protein